MNSFTECYILYSGQFPDVTSHFVKFIVLKVLSTLMENSVSVLGDIVGVMGQMTTAVGTMLNILWDFWKLVLAFVFGITNSSKGFHPLLSMINITRSPLHPWLTPFPDLYLPLFLWSKRMVLLSTCTELTFAFSRGDLCQESFSMVIQPPYSLRQWQ